MRAQGLGRDPLRYSYAVARAPRDDLPHRRRSARDIAADAPTCRKVTTPRTRARTCRRTVRSPRRARQEKGPRRPRRPPRHPAGGARLRARGFAEVVKKALCVEVRTAGAAVFLRVTSARRIHRDRRHIETTRRSTGVASAPTKAIRRPTIRASALAVTHDPGVSSEHPCRSAPCGRDESTTSRR